MLNIAFLETKSIYDLEAEIPMAYKQLKSYLLKYSKYSNLISMYAYKALEDIPEETDVIGVSSTSQNFYEAIDMGKSIREKYKNILLILGGNHISNLSDTLPVEYDMGVLFEGEQTFLDIIDNYISNEKRKEGLFELRGIVFYDKYGKIKINPLNDLIDPLDSIPFPVIENNDVPYLFSSRGCPYHCAFCSSTRFWKKFRTFSSDYIVSEIEYILTKLPTINYFAFWDDLLIADKKRFIEIVEKVESKKLNEKLQFAVSVRANLVNDDICRLLKRLNVVTASFGAESASDRILQMLKGKSVNVEMNQRAIDLLSKYGVSVNTGFVMGTPTETIEDVQKTFNFILKNVIDNKLNTIAINILMPLPGTEMWDYAINNNILTYPINWNRLKMFASYKTSKIQSIHKWIEERLKINSYYMNENFLPQHELLDMLCEVEENINKIKGLINANMYYQNLAMQKDKSFIEISERLKAISQKDISQKDAITNNSVEKSTCSKPEMYYARINPNLIDMIDGNPQKILDIGCAEGVIGEIIKKRFTCEYIGLELDRNAALKAEKKLDRVIISNVEKINLKDYGISENYFDYIIYGDILEHLYDPWTLLNEHKKFLKDDGYIVASIPNVRNLETLNALLNGYWTYAEEGVLDSTHLRFFTLQEIKKMFIACGFKIIEVKNNARNFLNFGEIRDYVNVELPKITIKNVTKEEALELSTIQFVIKAQKNKSLLPISSALKELPLVSICIPTYNGENFLAETLSSALSQTYPHIEIIISDDGSTDRTLQIAKSFQDKISKEFIIISHRNYGFIQNWNFCITKAHGKYIKFLFQDDLLEPDCIEKMVEIAEQDENVGMVFSPRGIILDEKDKNDRFCMYLYNGASNLHIHWSNLKPIQQGEELLSDPKLMDEPPNKIGEPSTVMIKKEVFEKLGGFDSELCQLVDMEMWLRIMSGYKIAFVNKMLSHFRVHLEQQTRKNAAKGDSTSDWQRYYDKIYKDQRYPEKVRKEALKGLETITQRYGYQIQNQHCSFEQKKPDVTLVSICIPTYNGEKFLSDALSSVLSQTYPNIEIIISDDGSTDRTLEIAKSFQDKTPKEFIVISHRNYGFVPNWNFCIQHAKGKYIKFLHQDDRLEPDCIRELVNIAEQDDEIGLVFSARGLLMSAGAENDPSCMSDYQHVRDLHKSWTELQTIQNGHKLLEDPNLFNWPINKFGEPTTVLIRKEVFDKIGGFDSELRQLVDVEMWLRIMSQYKIGFADKVLSQWRIHPEQQTRRNARERSTMTADWQKFYDKIAKDSRYPEKVRQEAARRLTDIKQQSDMNLRKERKHLSDSWLKVPPEFLEKAYSGDMGNVHRRLIESNLRNEPLTQEENAFLQHLIAELTKRSATDPASAINYLLAAMLYLPSGRLKIENARASLPGWLISDYEQYFK